MYSEAVQTLSDQAVVKLTHQRKSLVSHLVRSAMAGMSVRAAIVLTRTVVGKKMNLPADQLFLRAVLANWFVCLGVWMAVRVKSETAKILLIWWCMFTFITSGYEHSIANMCGLLMGLLLPHSEAVTWGG